MIDLIDFTNYAISSRNLQYGGRAGEKRGIIYNDEFWFLKFPKNTIGMNRANDISYVTSPLSEYLGSNIFKILGYDAQETKLGFVLTGNKLKIVCACKDFIVDDKEEVLIPFTSLRNDTSPSVMDKTELSFSSACNIEQIQVQLENNTILSKLDTAIEIFWDTVMIDMIINNSDRNEDNWGVIKDKRDNSYKLAPIYDCGNSFYSKTSDEK